MPGLGFLALTCTPWDCSSLTRSLLFQNDGIWVANSVVGVAFLSFAG